MNKGIVLTAVGIISIAATLVLSSGSKPHNTFLGNFRDMEIVIDKGHYDMNLNPDGSKKHINTSLPRFVPQSFSDTPGYCMSRIAIPTKYPFLLSVLLTCAGLVMLVTHRDSVSPSE